MSLTFSNDCPEPSRLLGIASKAAREAGRYISTHFHGLTEVEHKTRSSDVVTIHDRKAEQMIRASLLAEEPASRIWGEEFGIEGDGDISWFVDPIDGTSNYAGGLPLYCVSIGITWRGQLAGGVVYDPERDEMFAGSIEGFFVNGRETQSRAHAHDEDSLCLTNHPYEGLVDAAGLNRFDLLLGRFRAVRRLGSSALALAYVASGRADLCSELMTKPWDHAAGAALVLASGGGFEGRDSAGQATEAMDEIARFVAFGNGFDFASSIFSDLIEHAPQAAA